MKENYTQNIERAMILHLIGLCYYKMHAYDNAIHSFAEAIKIEIQFSAAYYYLVQSVIELYSSKPDEVYDLFNATSSNLFKQHEDEEFINLVLHCYYYRSSLEYDLDKAIEIVEKIRKTYPTYTMRLVIEHEVWAEFYKHKTENIEKEKEDGKQKIDLEIERLSDDEIQKLKNKMKELETEYEQPDKWRKHIESALQIAIEKKITQFIAFGMTIYQHYLTDNEADKFLNSLGIEYGFLNQQRTNMENVF